MTQEEKQLLLKDLSARLPYGVKINYSTGPANHCIFTLTELNVKTSYDEQYDLHCYPKLNGIYNYFDCLPYLRPMSSMTDKEWGEFSIFTGKTETYVQQICLDTDSMANPAIGGYKCVYWSLFDKCIDWLNSRHFDYRGLIEKGLALEAPTDMYKV